MVNRILCYRGYDRVDYDRLALICEQLGGWWESGNFWVEFYVPEGREGWFLLNSTGLLEYVSARDYLA